MGDSATVRAAFGAAVSVSGRAFGRVVDVSPALGVHERERVNQFPSPRLFSSSCPAVSQPRPRWPACAPRTNPLREPRSQWLPETCVFRALPPDR